MKKLLIVLLLILCCGSVIKAETYFKEGDICGYFYDGWIVRVIYCGENSARVKVLWENSREHLDYIQDKHGGAWGRGYGYPLPYCLYELEPDNPLYRIAVKEGFLKGGFWGWLKKYF